MDTEKLAYLFEAAVVLDSPERRLEFIEAETANDAVLRAELESLLAAHDASGDFLEEPAIAEAAALIPDRLGSNLIGETIGRWRVDALVDAGGMGSVFRATRVEEDFTQTGALKVVRIGFETEELVQRFARERKLLASVEHPHIARLLDGGTTAEGLPWLAMEYVDGLPIDVYADKKRLTIGQRLDLFEQLTDAIAYLHQNLITHRDIKLSNVLVDTGGHVRVLDFGIANLLDEASAQSEATTVERRLSLSIAAPEQVRGEAVSTPTDVYGLGMLLYRLLAGVAPYRIDSAMTAAEIEAVICERTPSLASTVVHAAADLSTIAAMRQLAPAKLVASLRGDLDTILAKALHKEPARRFGSVAELRGDLQRYRENRPILARPDSAAYRTGKFVRRHWRGLAATTFAMTALAVGLALALWQAEEARRQRDRAQAMNEFMQEVLVEADPYVADQDRTVREVLADASELMDERFAGQPLLEAALRQSVGGVQLTFLDLDAGEANLQRAMTLMGSDVPADGELRLRTEAHLAWVLYERGQYKEAVAAYKDVLARLTDAHDPEFRALLHNDIGVVLIALERWEEVVAHQMEAMRLSPDSPDRVSTLINLGYAEDGLGELEAAKEHYLQAIEQLRALGQRGVVADLAHALNNYGNILSQQNRDEEALPFYLESLEVRYRVFGEDADSVASQHLNVGRLLLDMQRPEEALYHLANAARIFPKYRDPDSIHVLVARASQARAQLLTTTAKDSRDSAVETLREVLETMQADDQVRISRFVVQIANWLAEAEAGAEDGI